MRVFNDYFKIHIIDDKKYYESKTVTLKGKKYKELLSLDPMKPSVLYADINDRELSIIKDWNIFYALRIKYAMCVLSLHGVIIMDYTLNLDEDEFLIENGKLVILNKDKLAIFNRYVNKEKK